jgi:RHS repeat-associated protein
MLSATGYSQVLEEFVNDYAPDGGDGNTSGGGSLWTSSLGLCPIDDHWPPGIATGITPETAPGIAPETAPGPPGTAPDLYRSYLIGLQALGQSFAPGYESPTGIEYPGETPRHVSGLTFNWLDGRGNVSQLLGSDGMMLPIAPFFYDAFGQPDLVTAFGSRDTTITPLGYAGEYRDARTGLIYLRDRWMNPATGRFTQVDRFRRGVGADLLGFNLYSYANGDGVNGRDPSGMWTIKEVTVGLAIFSLLVNATLYYVSRSSAARNAPRTIVLTISIDPKDMPPSFNIDAVRNDLYRILHPARVQMVPQHMIWLDLVVDPTAPAKVGWDYTSGVKIHFVSRLKWNTNPNGLPLMIGNHTASNDGSGNFTISWVHGEGQLADKTQRGKTRFYANTIMHEDFFGNFGHVDNESSSVSLGTNFDSSRKLIDMNQYAIDTFIDDIDSVNRYEKYR